MGVMCQISLKNPSDGVYRPGDVVRGAVRYALDEDTVYNKIIVSLKGNGKVEWSEQVADHTRVHFSNTEEYVDIDIDILEGKTNEGTLVPIGSYIAPFHFVLPHNIPSSFKDGTCKICYYIRIKFDEPGLLNLTKKFKSMLKVVNTIVPPPSSPIIATSHKALTGFFVKDDSEIKLQASLPKNFASSGEELLLSFEVQNNTDLNVKRVTANVIEKMTYISSCGHKKRKFKKLEPCKKSTDSIQKRSCNSFLFRVPMLPDRHTIEHTKIFNRRYKFQLTVKLPLPHRNLVLKIPILLGETLRENPPVPEVEDVIPVDDAPPSYWEVMLEDEMQSTTSK